MVDDDDADPARGDGRSDVDDDDDDHPPDAVGGALAPVTVDCCDRGDVGFELAAEPGPARLGDGDEDVGWRRDGERSLR